LPLATSNELADAVGNTPLINAVRASDTAGISELLASGANVNTPNLFTGETALSVACQNGDIDAASVLLSAEADPNMCDSAGYHPIHHAIRSRHDPVVRALIGASADVDAVDSVGESALLHAVDE
jgi:ankyrin repeat protein